MRSVVGAVMSISEPVERQRLGRLERFLVVITRCTPPLPMVRCVPRKRACSLRAGVILVFSVRSREFEVLTEEGCNFLFHLFGEISWATDPNEPIVSISDVLDANKGRIIDFYRWDASDLPYQFPECFCTRCSILFESPLPAGEFVIEWVGSFLFSTLLQAYLDFLHFLVKFV